MDSLRVLIFGKFCISDSCVLLSVYVLFYWLNFSFETKDCCFPNLFNVLFLVYSRLSLPTKLFCGSEFLEINSFITCIFKYILGNVMFQFLNTVCVVLLKIVHFWNVNSNFHIAPIFLSCLNLQIVGKVSQTLFYFLQDLARAFCWITSI